MITKERLEELIEQGATIWFYEDLIGIEIIDLKEKGYKYEIGVADADDREHLLKTSISKYGKSIDDWWWFSGLFETKEDLDWYIEFGCIERTERLELPTWEEFSEMSSFIFENKDGINLEMAIWCCDREDLQIKTIKITNFNDWNIRLFEQPLTKENYTIACRKAKELFLGEKK